MKPKYVLKESVAAIYCRLSKEDMDKDFEKSVSESIKNQKTMLEDYAQERGWAVYDFYIDDDYSGSDRDRPQFNKLITDSLLGCFNIVLCKKQSRFARDIEYVEKYIHGLFAERQIRFVAVLDNIDTGAAGRSVRKASQINSLVDEWYLSDLSENITAALTTKRRNSEFIGSWAPYGYRKDPGNKNSLIVDQYAAEIVRDIFARFRRGSGISAIARDLNTIGIPNPLLYKQIQGEKINPNPGSRTASRYLWSPSTVSAILHNRTYAGDLIQGKYRKASYKSKKLLRVPAGDWIVIPNCHAAVIDEETWSAVQKILNSGGHVATAGKSRRPLSGKIFCGECGSKLVSSGGSSGGRKATYLRCSSHARKSNCAGASIEASRLEDLLFSRISAIYTRYIDKDRMSPFSGSSLTISSSKPIQMESRLKALMDRSIVVDRKLKILYSDKLDGIISKDHYLEFKTKLEKESEELLLQQQKLKKDISAYSNDTAIIQNSDDLLESIPPSSSLRSEIADQLIDSVVVRKRRKGEPQEITINWNF